MYSETYKIAEHNIRICSLYDEVHTLCKDYQHNEYTDFTVEIKQQDIDFERRKSFDENIVHRYSDSYLETLAVYRKICEKLIEENIILFHGSAVAVDGTAYLFTAGSGVGKSTHTRLWKEYFGKRAIMVNDDKPLLKVGSGSITIFGTPWNGKHKLGSNIAVPLKSICVIMRSEQNHIEQITGSHAYTMLLQHVYRPMNMRKLAKTLDILNMISNNTAVYKLYCNMEVKAAEVAYNAMKG